MTPRNSLSAPIGSWTSATCGVEAVLDHVDAAEEVRADAVHLVDEAHAGDVVLVRLAPDRLGLGLDAGDRVEDRDRAVEDAQRALDLDREVDVAGRVDDVDPAVAPLARGRGAGDRDAALLLLDHPVHDGRALVHLTDLVGPTRVVEDPLGRGGLARIDVRHDPDVPSPREGILPNNRPPTLLWISHLSTSLYVVVFVLRTLSNTGVHTEVPRDPRPGSALAAQGAEPETDHQASWVSALCEPLV